VNSKILRRIGRGIYSLGSVKAYSPEISSRERTVARLVKANFPDISFCIWSSGLLNEFAHHLSGYPFILLDVEREVAESVYYQVKGNFSGVFLRPPKEIIETLLPDFRLPIVIRYLATESPITMSKGIPTVSIEKLLADIYCDMEFLYTEGSERRAIFRNAFDRYTVNLSRLLRYADRKGKKEVLEKYLRDSDLMVDNSNL